MSEHLHRELRRLDRPVLVPEDLSSSLFIKVADVAATKEGRVRDDLAPVIIESLEPPDRSRWRRRLGIAVTTVAAVAIIAGVVRLVTTGDDPGDVVVTTSVAAATTTTPPTTTTTVPPPVRRVQRADLPMGPEGWTALDPGPLTGPAGVAVWTGSQLFVWTDSGAASYNPRLESWTGFDAPPVRFSPDAVAAWTGAEVVAVAHGGATAVINPLVGEWKPAAPAPTEMRHILDAVWTGSELIVLALTTEEPEGGDEVLAARYDPAGDEWRLVASPPVELSYADASWTGSEVLVHGGPIAPDGDASGARFDPATGAWALLASQPLSGNAVASTWTGDRLVAWDYELAAAQYDMAEAAWSNLDPVPLPPLECRNDAVTVELGGGPGVLGWYCGTAALLDIGAGTWRRIETPRDDDLAPRVSGTPAAAGTEVYFWAADEFWVLTVADTVPGGAVDAGGGWSILAGSPVDQRIGASLTWAPEGDEILVWGGQDELDASPRREGAAYHLDRDEWSPIPEAPIEGRSHHVAVWTGSELIVWGGNVGAVGSAASGAAFDPFSGSWRLIPDAPIDGLPGAIGVWTGTEMILWGSSADDVAPEAGTAGAAGAAFDPETGAWRMLPEPPIAGRHGHSAVWTGSEMIIWGGIENERGIGTGAAYDPATDAWREIPPLTDLELTAHSGVWTGSEMVVLGASSAHLAREGENEDLPAFAGAAYNPVADTWRPLALPPFARQADQAPTHSATWTGSRVAVWVQSDISVDGPQVWLYDPVADQWEKGAVAPHEPSGPAAWAGDRLFIHGRSFPVDTSRALTYALGSDGATIPATPGTEVALDTAEPIDLRLYAFHPGLAEAGAPAASVIDLASRTRIDYAPGEHTLRLTAPIDRATVIGDRSLAVTMDGAVYVHDRALYREPTVVREITSGRAPGLAPAIYLEADASGSALWVFDYGQNCCSETARSDPGIVRLVDIDSGETLLNTETAPNSRPVQASEQGLLVNFEEFVPTADGFISDPDSHAYALLQPGGTLARAGDGHAVAMVGEAVVRVLCTGLVDQSCTLRITDEATGNRAVNPPGAVEWVQHSQPGTSLASPDGDWVVAAARRVNDVDGNPVPVLINTRLGTAEVLAFGRFDRPGVIVAWDTAGDWLVILGSEPVAFNVASKRFIQLSEVVPDGLVVYAAG